MRPLRSLTGLAGQIRGESMITYGVSVGLVAVVCVAVLAQLQDVLGTEYRTMADRMSKASPVDDLVYTSPCQAEFDLGTRADGIFTATAAGGASLPVACHFETTSGLEGGWTVVAHQKEIEPALSWNAGIASDRSVSNYFATSFALAEAQLPPHSKMAVGRRLDSGYIEILDGVAKTYTTGNIDHTAKMSAESLTVAGKFYDIHRHASGNYCGHDPQSPDGFRLLDPSNTWGDTLTFNYLNPDTVEWENGCGILTDATWSFAPRRDDAKERGYHYEGGKTGTVEPYAWIVLVR